MGRQDQQLVDLTTEIRNLSREVASLRGERDNLESIRSLETERLSLIESIEDLKIKKARVEEEHQREIREVKHQVGLEKKRQDWEHEQQLKAVATARQEAVLEVREENLTADKARFEETMEFERKEFGKQVTYLKDLMGQILDRLPTIKVDALAGGRANGNGGHDG